MLNEQERDTIIEKLKDEWPIIEDIEFNEFNLKEKLQFHSFKLIQYTEAYDKARYTLNQYRELKEQIEGKRYHYYRFEYDSSLNKSEIEKYYLPRDEKIIKANVLVSRQEIVVDYLYMCVKALEKVGWNMKNFIELYKIPNL